MAVCRIPMPEQLRRGSKYRTGHGTTIVGSARQQGPTLATAAKWGWAVFQRIGYGLDRFFPQLMTGVGTAALAFVPLYWAPLLAWLDGIGVNLGLAPNSMVGPIGGIALIVIASTAAVAGPWFTLVRSGRQLASLEANVFTGVKKTMIPIARRIIDLASGGPIGDNDFQKAITEITTHIRAFVSSNGTNADANYYHLRGTGGLATKLERVNETSSDARATFVRTRSDSAAAREENAVIARIVAGQDAFCSDVTDKKQVKQLTLDPSAKRDYVSFISVPVRGDDGVMGMLSANAGQPRVLQPLHREYLIAVAKLIVELERIRQANVPIAGNIGGVRHNHLVEESAE